MKFSKWHIVIIPLYISFLSGFGQEEVSVNIKDSLVLIKGQLLDEDTGEPVLYGHIINLRTDRGTISDTHGFFKISALRGDTLKISNVGYLRKNYVIPYLTAGKVYNAIIYMKKKIYALAPVTFQYLGTYQQFRYKIKNLKLPESDTTRLQDHLRTLARQKGKEAAEENPKGGISIALDFPNEYQKQLRRLEALKEKEKEQMKLEETFNRFTVQTLTGLEGEALFDFMGYCQLSGRIKGWMGPLEILQAIKDLYKDYKSGKELRVKKKDIIKKIE